MRVPRGRDDLPLPETVEDSDGQGLPPVFCLDGGVRGGDRGGKGSLGGCGPPHRVPPARGKGEKSGGLYLHNSERSFFAWKGLQRDVPLSRLAATGSKKKSL